MIHPARATKSPIQTILSNFSLRKSGAIIATQSGLVETSTTELATEVNSSEEIQEAKWKQRKAPDTTNKIIDFGVREQISCRLRKITNGSRIRLEIVSRHAAIARDGAPVCAKRINIEEVDVATIAKNNPIGGEMIGFG